jgi:uncharacterized surface protein with fasciclin (FAS1) repeats
MHKLFALAGAAALAVAGCRDEAGSDRNAAANATQPAAAAPTRTLAELLPASGRFRQAVDAAGLQATLSGPGPYTLLVPEDAAFGRLPPAEAQRLLNPNAKAELTTVLTGHVLPGTILLSDLRRAIDNGGGKATLATMADARLTATLDGERVVLTDPAGRRAALVGAEQPATNGVIHRVDAVLLSGRGEPSRG